MVVISGVPIFRIFTVVLVQQVHKPSGFATLKFSGREQSFNFFFFRERYAIERHNTKSSKVHVRELSVYL